MKSVMKFPVKPTVRVEKNGNDSTITIAALGAIVTIQITVATPTEETEESVASAVVVGDTSGGAPAVVETPSQEA